MPAVLAVLTKLINLGELSGLLEQIHTAGAGQDETDLGRGRGIG